MTPLEIRLTEELKKQVTANLLMTDLLEKVRAEMKAVLSPGVVRIPIRNLEDETLERLHPNGRQCSSEYCRCRS